MARRVRAVAAALIVVCSCGRSPETISATMRQDLAVMRMAIRDYRQDKGKAPRVLQDLVATHYLHALPKDPVTGAADWRVVTEEPVRVDEFTRGAQPAAAAGIVDVHSAAAGTDANGKPWSEY